MDIHRPRWVARIGVTRSTEACFLTADRQCTELPLLRLPRLVPEVVGCDPMRQTRTNKSADASPQALRDLAWLQAQLPTEMGGCNIDTAFSRADSDFSMSLLKNWRTLVAHNPDFALDEGGASKYPGRHRRSYRHLRVRPLGLEGGVREAHRPRQKQVPHRPRRLPD